MNVGPPVIPPAAVVTGFATPSIALGAAAGAGAAVTTIRSDSTLVAFDATVPTTSAVGDAAAAGAATVTARRDHVHGRESFATPSIALGTAAAAGAATTPIRSDSTIAAFDATVPTTSLQGDAAGTGAAGVAARRDHRHGRETVSATATVATSQTTTSTSFADLATVGPQVTITTNTLALVIVTCQLSNSVAGANIMGFAVSGATTIAAADTAALRSDSTAASSPNNQVSVAYLVTLTPGSNVFTAKYRVGSGTGTFLNRSIVVIPLN